MSQGIEDARNRTLAGHELAPAIHALLRFMWSWAMPATEAVDDVLVALGLRRTTAAVAAAVAWYVCNHTGENVSDQQIVLAVNRSIAFLEGHLQQARETGVDLAAILGDALPGRQ